MDDQSLQRLIKKTESLRSEDREATARWQNRIVSRMIDTAHCETERLEYHLSELPLSVVIYQWVIVRLKSRPWRLLVPVSLLLSILFHGVLVRVNLWQFLVR